MGANAAISTDTAAKKVPGRPFQPGQSGNPNGRPKDRLRPALRALLTDADIRKMMAQAIKDTLDPDPEVRAKARAWVTENADGKLIDKRESGDPGEFARLEALKEMNPDELRQLIVMVKSKKQQAS